MTTDVGLRAFEEGDLGFFDRLSVDPEAGGPFQWFGFRDVRARRRRWEADGYIGADSAVLAVVLAGTVGGLTSWRVRDRGGPSGVCYEIGVALLPEHRGKGVGTAAHRLLVEYLFQISTVHRLEALTDAQNLAEQKVLERCGFTREGVLRGAVFQNAAWRDIVVYGLLRDDHATAG